MSGLHPGERLLRRTKRSQIRTFDRRHSEVVEHPVERSRAHLCRSSNLNANGLPPSVVVNNQPRTCLRCPVALLAGPPRQVEVGRNGSALTKRDFKVCFLHGLPFPHWIGHHDHEQPCILVRFHDDLPGTSPMPRLDDPSAADHVLTMRSCSLKHHSKINLTEAPIGHTLQQVRTQFQLPIPPFWPPLLAQNLLPFFRSHKRNARRF